MRARSDSCGVCGGHEIDRDEVLDGEVLRLATCVRCAHRWTERGPRLVLATVRESVEVPAAA